MSEFEEKLNELEKILNASIEADEEEAIRVQCW